MIHKKRILELRAQGKNYNQIQKILGCSKSTIAYHCGKGQKEKSTKRRRKNRKDNPLARKVGRFKKDERILLRSRTAHFHKDVKNQYQARNFHYNDLIEKHGIETFCYLTGKPVNLLVGDSYQLDHIIPRSKGGANTLENCGITCPKANQAKRDMNVSEFLELCHDVLKHHGFKIEPPEQNFK